MNKIFPAGLFILTLILCTSCVTKKKYLIAENGRLEAIEWGNTLDKRLTDCKAENKDQATLIKDLMSDTTALGRSLRKYESLLSSNMSEQEKLNALLSEKVKDLNAREKTINDLQKLINDQNEKVQTLLGNVKNALMGFNSDELNIKEKDGKIYVAMSDKLLFESGSAKVDKRGEEALAKLAEVLNKQTDIDVMIEGHTDNKPINTVQFKDNWD